MSFRELTMTDVKEVLRRARAGQSVRAIARDGVADRKTVQRYIDAAKSCGIDLTQDLTDEQVACVTRRVQERPEVPRSAGWALLETHRKRIESWLTDAHQPLTLVRVHELLARDGVRVPYTTLRRFAHEQLRWRERKPTVRVADCEPGDEAQIDFGQMGYVVDPTGTRRKLWVLVVTLTMSRYMFVWPTFVQTLEAVCDALEAAWRFFGGVARRIVPDNMKAIVKRADSTDPELQRAFVEYAQLRGFFVDTARVRRPQDKGRVENQVPYVRERWFAGETFSDDIDELRRSAEAWCRDVAGARVHGTTRKVPRDVFEQEEQSKMLPPPLDRFDVPIWTEAKVHDDHHVQVAKALYSVPTRYLGQRVEVRVDRTTVKVYFRNELIKTHPRKSVGQRSTDPNDYPPERAGVAMRSIDWAIERAYQKGERVGAFVERLLTDPLPWIKMRQAYALFRLCDRYGKERVDAMCARALAFDVIHVKRIEGMLRNAQASESSAAEQGKLLPLPLGRFARDPSSFATQTPSSGKDGAR